MSIKREIKKADKPEKIEKSWEPVLFKGVREGEIHSRITKAMHEILFDLHSLQDKLFELVDGDISILKINKVIFGRALYEKNITVTKFCCMNDIEQDDLEDVFNPDVRLKKDSVVKKVEAFLDTCNYEAFYDKQHRLIVKFNDEPNPAQKAEKALQEIDA